MVRSVFFILKKTDYGFFIFVFLEGGGEILSENWKTLCIKICRLLNVTVDLNTKKFETSKWIHLVVCILTSNMDNIIMSDVHKTTASLQLENKN